MPILVVNAGSATLKLRVVDDDRITGQSDLDPWNGDDPTAAIEGLLASTGDISAVGHRIVHGGATFTGPVVVHDAVVREIAGLTNLAPLHQPRALTTLAAARRALPDIPHVASFDTAFHRTMPAAARTYALPEVWRHHWDLSRFGFHGLSHAWAARRARQLVDRPAARRVVTCHLGAGSSLCAVLDGVSVDTTMGFTPLDGLVMQTRSGSVDPGLLLWLLTEAGLDAAAVNDGLEHHAGLAGLSGTSGDMREVLEGRARADATASLAFDVYIHRLRREIAGMTAALDGVDILAFTGGVGEHAPTVRAETVATLDYLGLAIDTARNDEATGDADITAAEGAVARTVVVSAREELEIAAEVRRLLSA